MPELDNEHALWDLSKLLRPLVERILGTKAKGFVQAHASVFNDWVEETPVQKNGIMIGFDGGAKYAMLGQHFGSIFHATGHSTQGIADEALGILNAASEDIGVEWQCHRSNPAVANSFYLHVKEDKVTISEVQWQKLRSNVQKQVAARLQEMDSMRSQAVPPTWQR